MLKKRFGITASLIVVMLFVGLFATSATATYAARGATVVLTPNTAPQGSTVTIQISGFRPNEIVTLWQTFPDWSVLSHGDYEVDSNGEATLSWYVDASYPTGTHSMSARGNKSRRVGVTHFEVTLGEGMVSNLPMSVSTTADSQGSTFRFSAVGFGSREYVSVWMRTPNDEVVDLGHVISSREGAFDYELFLDGDYAEGSYHLTAYGSKTQNIAIASFDLVRGDMLEAAEAPSVYIYPRGEIVQASVVTIEGSNFGANEDVAVWITLPDARVVPFFETNTENDGFFVEELSLPSTLSTGTHYITVYGKSSGLRAISSFEVVPEMGR